MFSDIFLFYQQLPSEFLYHGTADRFLRDIMTEGLKPTSRLYAHLSKDVETADKVGKRHGRPVILKVHSGGISQDRIKFYMRRAISDESLLFNFCLNKADGGLYGNIGLYFMGKQRKIIRNIKNVEAEEIKTLR